MIVDTKALDLFAAVATARAGVTTTLGGNVVAVVLDRGDAGVAEVVDVHDMPDGIVQALATPAGRPVWHAAQASGLPVRISGSSLPKESKELNDALKAAGQSGLVVFPLIAERGVRGYIASPIADDSTVPRGRQDRWRLPCHALQLLQLAAASTALRHALTVDRRRPAELFEGLMVLDRSERVAFTDGLLSRPEWAVPDVLGRPLASLPGGDALSESADGGSELRWNDMVLRPTDGITLPMAVATVRLGDDDGLPGGRLILARDLRAEREAGPDGTARMLALAMRVSNLADRMSLLLRAGASVTEDEVVEAFAARARREVENASDVVQQALARCLPDEDPPTVQLNELVHEVLGRDQAELGRERIKLFTFLRSDLPSIPGDRLALLRALRILVTEAREAMHPGGGTLTARTWADEGWAYVAISDDGAGRESNRPSIAEPLFERGSDEPRAAGVAAVREIVERMAGRLMVERRPKVWHRATLMLRQERRRKPRPRTGTIEPETVPVATSGDKLCVLVVDDNAALRSVVRRYLEKRGHDVSEATDGVEGLALVRDHAFDRLLVDIQMPNKDGTEFFADLSAVDPEMRSRTIFVTGGYLDGAVERFIQESGRPAVKKPFDLAEMARAVES